MITFLASPKPFQGLAKEQQYRAVRNWQTTGPNVEVILFGDSPGIDEAGRDLQVRVVKQIECGSSGLPYFRAIAEYAATQGRYDLQVYLNCDILLSGILPALQQIRLPRFLAIGQRIDLGEGVVFDSCQPDWSLPLQRLADSGEATLHATTGMDYFAFPRGTWQDSPPVVIGRGGYDQALIASCLRQRIPVIDATYSLLALHQFHDYGHISGGTATVFRGPDARRNSLYAGGRHSTPNIGDADYVLRHGSLVPCHARGDWLRWVEVKIRFSCKMNRLGLVLRPPWRIRRALGWKSQTDPDLRTVLDEVRSLGLETDSRCTTSTCR